MERKTERITITLSIEQLNLIDHFVEKDFMYDNRSQFIRVAVSDYVSKLLLDKQKS